MIRLKILLVLQTPWGTDLGMSKVHYDLKTEYEKLGHFVDYLDWNRLYPRGQSAYDKIFGGLYSKKILLYLQKNACNFDVIDANFNCIPFPKSAYNFSGLVVYRSHGLQPLYRQIEQSATYKKMQSLASNKVSFKTRLGNLYRFLQKKDGDYELFNSIKYSDIIHALNKAEYNYFVDYGITPNKIFLVPNGIPDHQIIELQNIPSFEKKKHISFVGSWTYRKGISDLNSIVKEVNKTVTLERISLLGGGGQMSAYSFFEESYHSILYIKPHFSQSELPLLLKNTKVGIFPSYAEGFGLAILEQLALGIPVVAYDTPGPTDILEPINEGLLIKPGDVTAFGKKVAEILNLQESAYKELALKCKDRASEFKLSTIGQKFLDIYHLSLSKLNQKVG